MASNDDLFLPRILNNSIEQSKDTHLESNYNYNNEKDSQEIIDLKQININDKNYINKNINITNSTILDKLSSIKKKESKSSLNINICTNSTNLNNKSQQKILEQYQKQIFDLETKLSQIDTYHMKEISKLNEEIDIKNKNLKKLSKVNHNLKESLNNLTKKLDELIYKATKDPTKLKNNNLLEKEKNFEEQLLLKEKELKNQQNMINILSRDNKKLRHSLEIQNTFELNRGLSDKLFTKEQEIITLNKIIKDYEQKYQKHNECQKEIDILKEKLLNNQKELSEKKKEIFKSHKNITQLHSKIINSESAINIINKNIKERAMKKKVNMKLNLNVINNSSTPNKNQNTININNKNILSPIVMHRELSENKKNNISIENYNYNIIYNIFTKDEIDKIKKLYEKNDETFQEFMKKVEILEKYQNSKDKAYLVTIKKLKMKVDYYIEQNNLAENTLKDKDNKIFFLTREIKELIKKKKELNENNKKLIYLLNKATKNYEDEKKAKKELSNILLKYQSQTEKNENNENETDILKELNIDLNENNIIINNNTDNKDNIVNKDNKEINNNEIKIKNDVNSNDKNIIVIKNVLKPNPIRKESTNNKKIMTDKFENDIITNKDIKNSEKDLEIETIVSNIKTPRKKKYLQYQINSNTNHVEIKGIKTTKNTETLFETQPKVNIRNSLHMNSNKINFNKKNILNRRALFLPYKKSGSVDKPNKVIINEIVKKNDSKKSIRRRSLLVRDKSESAIVDLLNSDKKHRNNIKEKINTSKKNSKINVLFEN